MDAWSCFFVSGLRVMAIGEEVRQLRRTLSCHRRSIASA
jgi:hypothetical protein